MSGDSYRGHGGGSDLVGSQDDVFMALIRARNHIDTARWELKRVHPVMDPDEPCVHYEVWAALGQVLEWLNDL